MPPKLEKRILKTIIRDNFGLVKNIKDSRAQNKAELDALISMGCTPLSFMLKCFYF